MDEELTESELDDHLNNMPDVAELLQSATMDLSSEGQFAIDQGVAYVRDIAAKMCKGIEYGDDAWNEVWSAATIVIFNVLTAMSPIIEGLNEKTIDAVSLEVFLLGTRGKLEDLESILNT